MFAYIDIQDVCQDKPNAAIPSIQFKIAEAQCLGKNYQYHARYLIIDYPGLVAEASALVENRRNEQSIPLKDALG